jgi:hypothetical protein
VTLRGARDAEANLGSVLSFSLPEGFKIVNLLTPNQNDVQKIAATRWRNLNFRVDHKRVGEHLRILRAWKRQLEKNSKAVYEESDVASPARQNHTNTLARAEKSVRAFVFSMGT